MAMGIGPLYIERDAQDPLSPEAILAEPESAGEVIKPECAPAASPSVPSALTQAPQAPQAPKAPKAPTAPSTERLSHIGPGPYAGIGPEASSTLRGAGQVAAISRALQPLAGAHAQDASTPIKPATASAEQTLTAQDFDRADWGQLREMAASCRACPGLSSRLANVFGSGGPNTPIVIVGEAPGRDEDIQGVPFVGKSGQLLDNIFQEVGLERDKEVAIVNVLKCRPPENRNPKEDEVLACSGFLKRQLELINPKLVVVLGRFAAQSLLNSTDSLTHLRQQEHTVEIAGRTVPAFVSYHPSYLLRSPKQKLAAWRDFCRIRERYEALK